MILKLKRKLLGTTIVCWVLLFVVVADIKAQEVDIFQEIDQSILRNDTTAMNQALIEILYNSDDENKIFESTQLLIENGLKVNYKDSTGKTALHYATKRQEEFLPIIKYLLKQGADINMVDNIGNTPLVYCAYSLFFYYEEEIVKFLIDSGADLNAVGLKGSLLHIVTNHWSGSKTELDRIEYLIHKGADVNVSDANGWTPIFCAVDRGANDIVELLITKGADIAKVDKYGNTPFHYAANVDLVKLFVEKGCNIDAINKKGNTLLHELAYWENSIYESSKWRNSEWVRERKTDLVKKLIELGADISITNNKGQTALDIFKMEYDKKNEHDLLKLFKGDK